MNPSMTFDDRVLMDRMKAIAAVTRKEPAQIVRRVARQWVEMCIRLTPPTGRDPYHEGSRSALEMGEKAVERDLRRLFYPTEGIVMLQSENDVSKSFNRAVRKGKFDDAREIMREQGYHFETVSRTIDPTWHRQAKNNRGRVRAKAPQHLITVGGRINQYIKQIQKRIGYARSGWKKAAMKLGARARHFPAWASRHNGRGRCDARFTGFKPQVIFANSVSYIQRAGRQMRIMQRSQRRVLENLRDELVILGRKTKRAWKQAA